MIVVKPFQTACRRFAAGALVTEAEVAADPALAGFLAAGFLAAPAPAPAAAGDDDPASIVED